LIASGNGKGEERTSSALPRARSWLDLEPVRLTLCPSSGEQNLYYCIWCSALVLAVFVWSWVISCVHTAYDPAPHNHSQHNKCRTPYAVIHGLVLLMMGIMMPETC